MPQTLTDIKTLLAAHGLHPKKRFGQNFLHDANQMARIMAAADIRPGDMVLEVGAGTGALSERLLEAGAKLVAVEIDNHLEPILHERLVERFGDRVTLVMADVLASKGVIEPRVIQAMGGASASFKLIANLPYNIASPLLVTLALDHPAMTRAVVMVQREVADRLVAGPGGKDFGPLGIIVQVMMRIERVGVLSPGCFWPQPKVDSTILALTRREAPLAPDPHGFARFVHRLFNQRRKQIGTTLGRDTPLPEGISAQARPEQLTLEQLIALAGSSGC